MVRDGQYIREDERGVRTIREGDPTRPDPTRTDPLLDEVVSGHVNFDPRIRAGSCVCSLLPSATRVSRTNTGTRRTLLSFV